MKSQTWHLEKMKATCRGRQSLMWSFRRVTRPSGSEHYHLSKHWNNRIWFISVLAVLSFGFGRVSGQSPQLSVEYTVKVASTPDHLFHVTAAFKNIDQPAIDLSLPTWTPGWYTIENYAKNIIRF